MEWKTARHTISIDRPLVMGILNVTPDSFSDGGKFSSVEAAVARAEQLAADGADIIDIGGESTRPGSTPVSVSDEIARVIPVIAEVARRLDIPISVDTTKSDVAAAAIDAGASVINDISGLRWDASLADIAARTGPGLILMHSLGTFATMHSVPPASDVVSDVMASLRRSISIARGYGVSDAQIAVDIGIGFGKTAEQNLELIDKLDTIVAEFEHYPMVVGTSRKSFIGKLMNGAAVDNRLSGSVSTAVDAVRKGASIVRVHDVRETVEALKAIAALER